MFHLQRMDHDFYMERAEWKSRQDFKQEDVQRGMGIQHQYRGEKAERFFLDIVGAVSEIPASFRSKPLF